MEKLAQTSNNRSTSIDLFRVVSMFMVVVLHILGHGGVLVSLKPNTANWFILSALESISIIAVNCFALATGFLYVGKKIKIKQLINLYLQVLFFSLAIAVCFFIFGKQPFNFKTLIRYLLPISSGRYWYFSAYFMLFLLMPLLNIILENASKQFTFLLLLVALFLFGILVFVSYAVFGDTFKIGQGYDFVWLAVLYLFGGAIKKYEICSRLTSKKWLMFYGVSAILTFFIGYLSSLLNDFKTLPFVEDYTFILNILSSCFLLLFFASINIKSNKFITFFAKNSFGVYLLHEHDFIRSAFIKGKFTFIANYNVFLAVLTLLGIVVCIYLAGVLMEVVRKFIFRLAKIDALTQKIDNKIVNLYNKISKEDKQNQKDVG